MDRALVLRIKSLREKEKLSLRRIAKMLNLTVGQVVSAYYKRALGKKYVDRRYAPIILWDARDEQVKPTVPYIPGLSNSSWYKLDNPANVWQYEWRL